MIHKKHLPKQPAILFIGFIVFLSLHETARAESAHDRIALMLSGPDCPSVRHAITTTLQQQIGVLRVDPDFLPDHALIDITQPSLTEETLAAIANGAIGESRCRAEIMKSCITAGPSSQHTDPPQPANGLAQPR